MAALFLVVPRIMVLVVVVEVRQLGQQEQVQQGEMVDRELLIQLQVHRLLMRAAEEEEHIPAALAGQVVLVEVGQLLRDPELMQQ